MKIHFLGVGEACDGNQPNTSILLKTDIRETAGRILLDKPVMETSPTHPSS
jgi:hypothetical protein